MFPLITLGLCSNLEPQSQAIGNQSHEPKSTFPPSGVFLSVALLQYCRILTHAGINLPGKIKEESFKGHREADPLKDRQTDQGLCWRQAEGLHAEVVAYAKSEIPSMLWELQNYSSKV